MHKSFTLIHVRCWQVSIIMDAQQFNERLFKIKTHLALKTCTELILHGLQLVAECIINKVFPSVEFFIAK
jgi:hypothetical protein